MRMPFAARNASSRTLRFRTFRHIGAEFAIPRHSAVRRTPAFCLVMALALAASDARAAYQVDFEGENETKGSYATGTVLLGGLEWELTQALIGTLAGDKKNGLRSLRLRRSGDMAGLAGMLEDKAGGIGEISFLYARYGTDTGQPGLFVEFSTDYGHTWTQAGEPIESFPDALTLWSAAVEVTGEARIRLRTDCSGVDKSRINIDDIILTDFSLPLDVPEVTTLTVTNLAPTSARAGGSVVDDHGADITERGVVFNTAGLPTTHDTVAAATGTGLGTYVVDLYGLTPGETYHVRAYAVNAEGVGYGRVESFAAACFTHAPTALDATVLGNGAGFSASWTALEGATGYRLYLARCNRFIPAGVSTIFRETMGDVTDTTTIAAHEAAGGFDNLGYRMGDGGAAAPADIRQSSPSSGYSDAEGNPASGGANVFFTGTIGERGFGIDGIDTRGFVDLRLGFGYRKGAAAENATFSVEWSAGDGESWSPITVVGLPDEGAGAVWYPIDNLTLPQMAEDVASLALRWVKRGSVKMRIDDVLLRGDGGAGTLLPGYAGLDVAGLEQAVVGLPPGVYYYRVQAVGGGDCLSAPSNIMSVRISPRPTLLQLR